ncbi:MAG: TonB-dependent receptor [Candidatus Neomarinimicrobiota bacterium]
MKAKIALCLAAFLILTLPPSLSGGVTGKITGKITDRDTGEPLVGANVILQGTPQGAATDLKGVYIILNVRGGKYAVVASMIGYKRVEIKNVTILADHTSSVDIEMEQSAIEGEEVTITAERPVIVRDQTATTTTVLAEQIENMPVNSYMEVLNNVAGVVENNNGGGDDGIHIRGGRSNEIAYMVDGFWVEDAIYGGMGTDVSRPGISELTVITGAFNAEYGEAMSGVVNILTKEGTPDFNGSLRFSTDKFSRPISEEQPSFDWNTRRFEGSLGGPIPVPGLRRNFATFFISGDIHKTDTYLGRTRAVKPVFHDLNGNDTYDPDPFTDLNGNGEWDLNEPYEDADENGEFTNEQYVQDIYDLDQDNDEDELLVKGHVYKNATFRDQARITSKLVVRPFSSIKLTAGGIFNRVDRRPFSMNYKLYQDNRALIWEDSDLLYVNLNHALSSKTFYNIKVSRFVNRSLEGLEKYMDIDEGLWRTKREISHTGDVARINTYWSPQEPYGDADGDGEYTPGEPFTDVDGDGIWDSNVFDTGRDGIFAESFTDENNNWTWDSGEDFVDTNGDGIWNGPDEGELDGIPTAGEEGVVDRWWNFYAEPFHDTPDGIYRSGSADNLLYDADQDGVFDEEDGDFFIDVSGDGVWRPGEDYVDLDGSGDYSYGITPPFRTTAFEGVSNYEFYGPHTVLDANGDSVREALSEDNFYETYASRSTSIEGNFTSQINQHHLIKIGGEYRRLLLEDFRITGFGGGIWGVAGDPSYVNWKYEPYQGSLYIQDKIEFKDWIINLGVRWDYLDPNSEYADPTRSLAFQDAQGNYTRANAEAEPFYDEGNGKWDTGEFFVDTDGDGEYTNGEIFTDVGNGVWDSGEFYVDANGDGTWTGAVERYGYFDENGDFVEPPRATKKWQLSPRLGIGYPITDRIAFHFSYGQFFQYPDYDKMFRLANQGDPNIYQNSLWPFPYSLQDFYIPPVGNPNLKPETTIAYEFGIRWQISQDFVMNTTVFYKDIYDYISAVIRYVDPTDYAIFENLDYGNAKGIEFNLKKLLSNNYSFSIVYSYQKAVSNAANEYTHWNEAYLASVYGTYPSLKTIIMPWDQPHTFNFTFDYRNPKGYGMNLIGNLGSGLPFTPTDVRGLNLADSNSGRMPSTAVVDMKAYRDFRFDRITARLFLDVRNVLNKRNILNVFNNSGKPDESLNPNSSAAWEDRPQYFGSPRHIEAGISLMFD